MYVYLNFEINIIREKRRLHIQKLEYDLLKVQVFAIKYKLIKLK